jgi:hypothetical protein
VDSLPNGGKIDDLVPGGLENAELERVSGGASKGTHIKEVTNG